MSINSLCLRTKDQWCAAREGEPHVHTSSVTCSARSTLIKSTNSRRFNPPGKSSYQSQLFGIAIPQHAFGPVDRAYILGMCFDSPLLGFTAAKRFFSSSASFNANNCVMSMLNTWTKVADTTQKRVRAVLHSLKPPSSRGFSRTES